MVPDHPEPGRLILIGGGNFVVVRIPRSRKAFGMPVKRNNASLLLVCDGVLCFSRALWPTGNSWQSKCSDTRYDVARESVLEGSSEVSGLDQHGTFVKGFQV
jgi:hypothetical protein